MMPRKPPPVAPTCFVPSCPADFVGQAGKVAEVLLRKAERLKANPDQPLKLLVSGAPGISKTDLMNLLARTLVTHPAAIEDVNSREVGLQLQCTDDRRMDCSEDWGLSDQARVRSRNRLHYGLLVTFKRRKWWAPGSVTVNRVLPTAVAAVKVAPEAPISAHA